MIVDATDEFGQTYTLYAGPEYMNIDTDKELTIKTGSSAVFTVVCTDEQDPPRPVSLENYEIFIDFIDPRTRVPITETSLDSGIKILDLENGVYSVNAGDTINWPLGHMYVDIKYTNNGVSQHTDTFYLNIIRGNSQ